MMAFSRGWQPLRYYNIDVQREKRVPVDFSSNKLLLFALSGGMVYDDLRT